MEPSPVSSTAVRQKLAQGETPEEMPPQVMEYIRLMGLYGQKPSPAGASAFYTQLRRSLSDKRLVHSLLVAHTARKLARLHGVDEEQAAMAGLLHDCAKCMPLKDMQRLARENRLTEDESLLESGALLHAIAGACKARLDYGMTDPVVLDAIRRHTTGAPGMSRLDMAVWLADAIEPTRAPYPLLEQLRETAEVSLERAILASMENTLAYVRKSGKSVHPATMQTIQWLRTLPECQ